MASLNQNSISSQTQFSENTGKVYAGVSAGVSGEKIVLARELFLQTATNLGVPRDALSISLLAFMRFFSLSPNPAVMHSLRREVLSARKVSSPADANANAAANADTAADGTVVEKAVFEAEALGAVTALDKGTVLSPEALDRYARFFVPPIHAPDSDGRRGEKECARNRDETPQAEKIKALAEGEAGKDGFLNLFNRLPGKNGRYWKVFPFNITVKGTELKVFLRTLNRGLFLPESGEFLFIDVIGPKRQWRCFLENSAGTRRADIRVYPGQSPGALALLRKEAKRFLGTGAEFLVSGFGGFEEILVRNGDDLPSWADELCAENLPSVDEEA